MWWSRRTLVNVGGRMNCRRGGKRRVSDGLGAAVDAGAHVVVYREVLEALLDRNVDARRVGALSVAHGVVGVALVGLGERQPLRGVAVGSQGLVEELNRRHGVRVLRSRETLGNRRDGGLCSSGVVLVIEPVGVAAVTAVVKAL